MDEIWLTMGQWMINRQTGTLQHIPCGEACTGSYHLCEINIPGIVRKTALTIQQAQEELFIAVQQFNKQAEKQQLEYKYPPEVIMDYAEQFKVAFRKRQS